MLPPNTGGKPDSGNADQIAPGRELNPHLRAVLERLKGGIASVGDEPGRGPAGEVERVRLLAEWHGERAPLDEDHLAACQAMLAVGIALREVAGASTWSESPEREPMDAGPDL